MNEFQLAIQRCTCITASRSRKDRQKIAYKHLDVISGDHTIGRVHPRGSGLNDADDDRRSRGRAGGRAGKDTMTELKLNVLTTEGRRPVGRTGHVNKLASGTPDYRRRRTRASARADIGVRDASIAAKMTRERDRERGSPQPSDMTARSGLRRCPSAGTRGSCIVRHHDLDDKPAMQCHRCG